MSEKLVFCPKCLQYRVKYIKNIDYCQCCYRKVLDEYSLYDYKVEKSKLNDTNKKICEMLIEEGIEKKEIHKILGLNKDYVQQIINRYTIRVNTEGEKRPF